MRNEKLKIYLLELAKDLYTRDRNIDRVYRDLASALARETIGEIALRYSFGEGVWTHPYIRDSVEFVLGIIEGLRIANDVVSQNT